MNNYIAWKTYITLEGGFTLSGGAFDYQDNRLIDIADVIRTYIAKCRKGHEYYMYPDEFLNEMITVYRKTLELQLYLHRIDWVFSGDDSPKTYFERIQEDLNELKFDDAPETDDEWLEKWDDDC